MNDAQYIISLNQNKLKEDGNRRSSVQVMTTGKTTQVMTTEKTMESINDIYNGGLSTMEQTRKPTSRSKKSRTINQTQSVTVAAAE